jgi:hypothetical protein
LIDKGVDENVENYLRREVKKINLSLCLTTKHYTMKAYEGVNVEIHIFFNSALAGDEWSLSRPGRFTT